MTADDLTALVYAYFGDDQQMLPTRDTTAMRAVAHRRGVSAVEFVSMLQEIEVIGATSFREHDFADGVSQMLRSIHATFPLLAEASARKVVNAVNYSYR